MRFEAVLLPNTLHRRMPDTHLLGHRPRAPVRCILRFLLGSLHHDLQANSLVDALLTCPWSSALLLEQSLDAALHIGLLPAPDGGLRDLRLALDRTRPKSASRQQHDAGASRQFLRRIAIGNEPLQCRSITGPDVQACFDLSHAAR